MYNRDIDFPFLGWFIRCVDKPGNVAKLDVWTKRIKLSFEIGDNWVALVDRTEKSLSHLNNKHMKPGVLLLELQRSGINLLPRDKDAQT